MAEWRQGQFPWRNPCSAPVVQRPSAPFLQRPYTFYDFAKNKPEAQDVSMTPTNKRKSPEGIEDSNPAQASDASVPPSRCRRTPLPQLQSLDNLFV